MRLRAENSHALRLQCVGVELEDTRSEQIRRRRPELSVGRGSPWPHVEEQRGGAAAGEPAEGLGVSREAFEAFGGCIVFVVFGGSLFVVPGPEC